MKFLENPSALLEQGKSMLKPGWMNASNKTDLPKGMGGGY